MEKKYILYQYPFTIKNGESDFCYIPNNLGINLDSSECFLEHKKLNIKEQIQITLELLNANTGSCSMSVNLDSTGHTNIPMEKFEELDRREYGIVKLHSTSKEEITIYLTVTNPTVEFID